MVTFVLAGVVGSVLAVGGVGLDGGQVRTAPKPGIAVGSTAGSVAAPSSRASAPYDTLFTQPAADTKRPIRFGQRPGSAQRPDAEWDLAPGIAQSRQAKPTPDVIVDSSVAGPCGSPTPSNQPTIDPGIVKTPQGPPTDFKIRRIVPKGCMDVGIFLPKRQK